MYTEGTGGTQGAGEALGPEAGSWYAIRYDRKRKPCSLFGPPSPSVLVDSWHPG